MKMGGGERSRQRRGHSMCKCPQAGGAWCVGAAPGARAAGEEGGRGQ